MLILNAGGLQIRPSGVISFKRSSNANSIPGMTYYNPIVIESNFHNSHNRVQDWIKYTK